jgi:transcriptional regulator with PAS, ATPase and Fis domain
MCVSNRLGFIARQRDRRLGVADLVSSLSHALADRADVTALRRAFEAGLRRLVRVRSIELRDGGRWSRHDDRGAESIALEVPGTSAVLDATFDPAAQFGEWDFQVLNTSAQLASLVVEIERTRSQLVRAGLAPGLRPKSDGAAPLIGSTPAMQALRSQIERVATTDFTVLLEGESGVGKELVARQIHDLSRRQNGPFVAINCAALVETLLEAELFGIEDRTATGVRGRRGKFEHADGGTLFLDEIGDLSASAQAKLLRVIQDLAVERVGGQGTRRVDIRIVAATNRNLGDMAKRNLFRTDLFYRVSGVDIRVPPLRERAADIVELAEYFLERHRPTRHLRLSAGAADALSLYPWPGNVRELERLMERAVALADGHTIELDDLPPLVRGDYDAVVQPSLERGDTMRAWGSRYARLVLERHGGNKAEACRTLGISYHTLNAYLRFNPRHGACAPVSDEESPVAEVSGAEA